MSYAPDAFHVASHADSGWAVVEVQGDLDLDTAPRLRQALLDHAEQGDHRVVLNLRQVGFLDSSGLSAIIAGLRAMESHRGCLVLAAVTSQVQRLLDITHVSDELPVYAGVAEAIASGAGVT